MQDFINPRQLLAQVHEQRDELVNTPLRRLKWRDRDVVTVGVPGTFDTDAVLSLKDPKRVAVIVRLGEFQYRAFTDDNINGQDEISLAAATAESHANVTLRKLKNNTEFLDNEELMRKIHRHRDMYEDKGAVPGWSDEFIDVFDDFPVPNSFHTLMVVLKKNPSKICAIVRLDKEQFRVISDLDINGRDDYSLGAALGHATSRMLKEEL